VADAREIGTIEKRAGGDDFRTNEACGGSARPATAPGGGVELVVAALDAVGLVTGTADLLELDGGIAVLEVNSAPGLEYPSIPELDLAGPMVACVMRWMDECDADSALRAV
jgi:ribosomal protein S6--L-glutamate ligase